MESTTYYDNNGHLNDLGQMLYVDAIKIQKVGQLPREMPEHVFDCDYCNKNVRSLYDLVAELTYPIEKHPTLEVNELSDLSLGEIDGDLEAILTQLKAEAVLIPRFEKLMEEQVAYRNKDAIGIQLQSPKPEQLCRTNLAFIFATSENLPLTLTIQNHEKRIYRAKFAAGTTQIKINFQPKSDFPVGMYYWRLVLKGKKPLVGKIYIV